MRWIRRCGEAPMARGCHSPPRARRRAAPRREPASGVRRGAAGHRGDRQPELAVQPARQVGAQPVRGARRQGGDDHLVELPPAEDRAGGTERVLVAHLATDLGTEPTEPLLGRLQPAFGHRVGVRVLGAVVQREDRAAARDGDR